MGYRSCPARVACIYMDRSLIVRMSGQLSEPATAGLSAERLGPIKACTSAVDTPVELSKVFLTSGCNSRVGAGCGWACCLNLMLLLYPVPRSSFLHWLTGTSFPTLIKYHR